MPRHRECLSTDGLPMSLGEHGNLICINESCCARMLGFHNEDALLPPPNRRA